MSSILEYALKAFLIAVAYQVWKRDGKTGETVETKVKVIATLFIWFIFSNVGSAGNADSDGNVEASPDATSTEQVEQELVYSLEQKQADYEAFYREYKRQGQAVVMTQTTLLSISNTATSEEELYLALNELSRIQSDLAIKSAGIEIPASLKEYKQLSSGKVKLAVASRHFKSAIENFQKYLDKNDLKALSDSKFKSELGEGQLGESIDEVEAVGHELGVDIEAIDINNN